MKKRKNIILSAITCFVSICLLMLGVYSASNPGVSINGQVSYTARDASVLVQGKTSKDGSALVFDTVPSTKNFDGLTEKTSGESYLDWTVGEGHDVAGDQLKAWAVGDLNFVEGTDGVKPIKLGFSFTNYSNFPVEATIVLNTSTLTSTTNVEIVVQTSDEIENNELTKTITLAKGETKSCEFVYKVIDDSKDASGAKIDVKVDFANANAPKPKKTVVNISLSDLSGSPDYYYRCISYKIKLKTDSDFQSEETLYLQSTPISYGELAAVSTSIDLPYDNNEIEKIELTSIFKSQGPGLGFEGTLAINGDGISVTSGERVETSNSETRLGSVWTIVYTLTNIPAEFTILG